jgi:phage recombination protein Bet
MNNSQITPAVKPSALAIMASRFSVDPAKLHTTLKNTVFKGASDEEMLSLVVVANSYGLNPLTREVFAFPAKGGGIVPVVSVDGWLRIINDQPQMDGLEFEFNNDAKGELESVTAIIYRKDRTRPIKVTEYLAECKRNTEPWKMTHRMLRHKALIQCARVAFGFSGIYDEDEAERIKIANATVVTSSKPEFTPVTPALPEPEPEPQKPKARKAKPQPEPEPIEEEPTPEYREDTLPLEPTAIEESDELPGLPAFPGKPITPQRKLYQELSDAGIIERSFIGWLGKRNVKIDTVMSMTDAQATDCLNNFAAIQEALG